MTGMSGIAGLAGLVARGRLSRRDFLQRALGAGLTLGAATQLFATAARAEPKTGGFAKFGLAHGATTDTLDPVGYPDTFTQCAFWGAMSNGLTEIDSAGNVVPEIAESFESSNGAKTWIFRLRNGVTFHNGKKVSPEDVIASFRHHMGAASKSAAKSLLEPITDMKADGANAVVFTLASGNADFPYIVSDYHLPIMPANGDAADWQSGIRTGAFVLENFQPGVSAKLKRNPNYFKNGKPYLDEVEFLAITDVAARMNAMVTGAVDYISRADLKTLQFLKRNPDIEILEMTGYSHYTLPMNVTVAPFDNADVRLALKWAIDRDEIVQKIFLGHASAGNDNPIAPTAKFAINPQPVFSFDPDRAKHHLKKAGLENLKVDLSVAEAAFAGAVDTGMLIRESAAKCGIDVNVIREAEDGYWDNVWMKKPWCASFWGGRPTPDPMFTSAYAADAAWNETFWKNPRFNELLVQARAETDEAKRAAMYAEMQQINHDDNGNIVLVFNNYVSAHSKKLAHADVASNWDIDGYKIAERWWRV